MKTNTIKQPIFLAPNCFCSTDSIEDSPDSNIPPFKFPKDISSKEDAFKQLYEVVMAYEPGQNGIDGGGFEVKTNDPKTGYMYVQFESLKNGFIDDVEFAIAEMCSLVKETYPDFIAGQVFHYAGFISEEGTVGERGKEGNHIAIITYWKSFEAHEKSHKDKLFKKAFSNLMKYCDDTKELGYQLLWQGEK